MTALIIVESMFGNTRMLADCIAEGLSESLPVEVRDVGSAPDEIPVTTTLLVLGAPTHSFGMSRLSTRTEATKRGASAAPERGVREWLDGLRPVDKGLLAACFDTRVDKPFAPGSAARGIGRRLHKMGCQLVVPPVSFFVSGTPGPLEAGEADHARAWGEKLASELEVRGQLPTADGRRAASA